MGYKPKQRKIFVENAELSAVIRQMLKPEIKVGNEWIGLEGTTIEIDCNEGSPTEMCVDCGEVYTYDKFVYGTEPVCKYCSNKEMK